MAVLLIDTGYLHISSPNPWTDSYSKLLINRHSRLVNSNVPILHICAEQCECGTHVAGHVTTPLHADTLYRGLMGTTAFLGTN